MTTPKTIDHYKDEFKSRLEEITDMGAGFTNLFNEMPREYRLETMNYCINSIPTLKACSDKFVVSMSKSRDPKIRSEYEDEMFHKLYDDMLWVMFDLRLNRRANMKRSNTNKLQSIYQF